MRANNAEDALCEAELELKSGSPDSLLTAAAKLFSAQPIRLAKTSKAERGYRLALGKSNGKAAPERAEQPCLREEQSCGEALGLIVQSAADQIAANRRAVLETEDPAAAHQLRIGLRRLRSALRAFRPLCDAPAASELEEQARSLSRTVGELRDADVLIEQVYAPVADKLAERSGRAAAAAGAARPSRARPRARALGPHRSALVGAAALSRLVAAHDREHRGPERSQSASSPARRSSGAGRRWPIAAIGSTS